MLEALIIALLVGILGTIAYGIHFLSDKITRLETLIEMKTSEVKVLVAAAAARSSEAFSEISTRLADLQKKIDDLIAGAGDPEVTDAAFLADLNTLKTNTDSLADIVPNVVPVPTPAPDPVPAPAEVPPADPAPTA